MTFKKYVLVVTRDEDVSLFDHLYDSEERAASMAEFFIQQPTSIKKIEVYPVTVQADHHPVHSSIAKVEA